MAKSTSKSNGKATGTKKIEELDAKVEEVKKPTTHPNHNPSELVIKEIMIQKNCSYDEAKHFLQTSHHP